MARTKSIQDIGRQYARIQKLASELFTRNATQKKPAFYEYERERRARRIGDRYITNLIKAQTKGFTEEQLNSGRGASYTKKMGYNARLGLSNG